MGPRRYGFSLLSKGVGVDFVESIIYSILSSTRIRSWSLPGWQSPQIFNPEPLHLLSFQCRTSYLSWTTGMHNIPIFSNTSRKFLFFRFSVCLSRSDLFPCSLITAVHWIHFGKVWKYSTSSWMGRLWWFEGNGKGVPCFTSNYVY